MGKEAKKKKPGTDGVRSSSEASATLEKPLSVSSGVGTNSSRLPVSLFLISLLVNLIILSDYWNSPFSRVPAWDGEVYWRWAQDIAAGNWLGNIIFHQSPLYPYFLAVLLLFFGKNLFLIYLVQAVFSVASVVLVYSITKKILRNEAAGFVAGLLFALYGFQIFYSLKILSEGLSVLLMLVTTRLILELDREAGRGTAICAGISFGLLLTTKPHLLLATPLLLGYFFLVKGTQSLQSVLRKSVLFLVPVVLIVSVVAARNYAVGKNFVLISSNGGENFFIGNHENSNGMYTYVEGISHDIKFQNEDVNAVAQKGSNP